MRKEGTRGVWGFTEREYIYILAESGGQGGSLAACGSPVVLS